MDTPNAGLQRALQAMARGDLKEAWTAISPQAEARDAALPVLALAGLVACRLNEPGRAIPLLRRALALDPSDKGTRFNLAMALLHEREEDAAIELCLASGGDPRLQRLAGVVYQGRRQFAEARTVYEAAVAAVPSDFESWNNLGNVLVALDDPEPAIVAFERAITWRREEPGAYLNLSKLLARLDRLDARLRVMQEAVRHSPDNPDVLLELGLAEAGLRQNDAAIGAFRKAIDRAPDVIAPYLELAMLYETLNRLDDLYQLADQAHGRGLRDAELTFIDAWALRRKGDLAGAMTAARAVPDTIHPVRRAQLIGELADRLGDTDLAFQSFETMNAESIAASPAPPGEDYLAEVRAAAALVTPAWVSAWTPPRAENAANPVFIAGFPRSGTTLLDTLLMNLPGLHVMEELPVMRQVEVAVEDPAGLPNLGDAALARLRTRYFDALRHIAPPSQAGQRIVDKYPLHLARLPLIYRVFPQAPIILVERHPCDSVLSCFMSNFQLNRAMRCFTTLEEAATLYDAAFDCWTRAEALLPARVHRIRYERMVDDLEAEMRALLAFLDIAWDDRVLDNMTSARSRDQIKTASYSQVTEPIYRRSLGRWERYRRQMAPVLPILAPWAERMGYTL